VHLIVGLGNPGRVYRNNRHNVGFMLIDKLAEGADKRFEQFVDFSLTCRLDLCGQEVILAKPQTFMNLSGRAVKELLGRYSLKPSQLLIVYDDFVFELGMIRIRPTGSAAGHNGMESVIERVSSEEIPRLRIGISQGQPPLDYAAYVLEDFEEREGEILEEVLESSSQAINTILSDGLERAMSLYN